MYVLAHPLAHQLLVRHLAITPTVHTPTITNGELAQSPFSHYTHGTHINYNKPNKHHQAPCESRDQFWPTRHFACTAHTLRGHRPFQKVSVETRYPSPAQRTHFPKQQLYVHP